MAKIQVIFERGSALASQYSSDDFPYTAVIEPSYFSVDNVNALIARFGGNPVLTIDSAEVLTIKSQFTGRDEERIVLGFAETETRLIVNPTNAQRLEKIFSSHLVSNWGGQIVLSVGKNKNKDSVLVEAVPTMPAMPARRPQSAVQAPAQPAAPQRLIADEDGVLVKKRTGYEEDEIPF